MFVENENVVKRRHPSTGRRGRMLPKQPRQQAVTFCRLGLRDRGDFLGGLAREDRGHEELYSCLLV